MNFPMKIILLSIFHACDEEDLLKIAESKNKKYLRKGTRTAIGD